jgi:hypothetical protein
LVIFFVVFVALRWSVWTVGGSVLDVGATADDRGDPYRTDEQERPRAMTGTKRVGASRGP